MSNEGHNANHRWGDGILAVGLAHEDLARLREGLPGTSILSAPDSQSALRMLDERPVSVLVADPASLAELQAPIDARERRPRSYALEGKSGSGIEALLRELTVHALREQVSALTEATKTQEDFALLGRASAGILHEVANGLDGARRLVALGLRGTLPPEEKERQLHDGLRAMDRTIEILRTMLAFARNARVSEPKRSLRVVLDEAILLAEGQRGTTVLRTAFDPVAAEVPGFVVQILVNLLRNAYRAAPTGEVRLVSRQDKGELRVTVEDSGEGFLPEASEGLFEPALRMSEDPKGTGLGLSLSRRLAERAGGRLVAASEGRGRGARFTLTLPLGREIPS